MFSFPTSKTCLRIVSFNVRELELNWCSNEQSKKKNTVLLSRQNLDIWKSGLIVINEMCQISRNWQRQGPKFRKLQEAIWLTAINEIFKFPPDLGSFCQVNYFFELSSGCPNYPTQKWYIWASFQTSRNRFGKLEEAIWLIVINEIFKFPQHFDPFGQVNYLFELSSDYWNCPVFSNKFLS